MKDHEEKELYKNVLTMKPHTPFDLNKNSEETLKSSFLKNKNLKNTKKEVTFGTQQIHYNNNNVTLKENPMGKEEIEYQDFVDLQSSDKVQKNNRKHRKKEKRLLNKKEGKTNVNRNEYYLNIKKGNIPVFVNKLIENGDRISDSILRTQFYIGANETIGDLEKMVENYIETVSDKQNVQIQLFVYDQENKDKPADKTKRMKDIFNECRNENGILDINYRIVSEGFEIVDV